MTDTNNILGENMLPLADIAKPVFNITPRIAQRKAATNTLPVPAFRIGGTRKGPLYVLKDDLEKWVSDHDLRHEGISRLFEAGLTIPEVSLISGHTSWESLKRYTHIQPKHVLEKLGAAKPKK